MTRIMKARLEADHGASRQGEDWQARLDCELAESFPASDPPSISQPGVRLGGPQRNQSKGSRPHHHARKRRANLPAV
ncbi:MAG: hypothetical protein L0Y57_07475 [Beijerinckiaceae bacterium]|nr:hypothetical protein [Beijerinckiaceae bacterium]